MSNFDYTTVNKIIENCGSSQRGIFAILRDIQKHYNYLPKEIFPYISEKLSVSEKSIYEIVANYSFFSLEPKGKFIIKVCDGTRCHVNKSTPIIKALREKLGLDKENNTTDNLLFTLETVYCLGACGVAPSISVNDKIYPAMTPEKAVALVDELEKNSYFSEN